jgi:hypothetical protein
MSKFSGILEIYKKNKNVIAIYRWNDDNGIFMVGRVVSISSEYYILAVIDEYGKSDGFTFQRLDNIARIEVDSTYIKRIKKTNTSIKIEETSLSSINLIDDLLEDIKTTSTTCTIELEEVDVVFSGKIIKNENDLVHLEQLDIYGKIDGTLIFEKEYILSIEWNSREEILLDQL